jgi:dTDP-alpha-D-glucose dehydrogenase
MKKPTRSRGKRGDRGSVAIVGFGYVGTIIGAFLAERGFRVTAVETRPEVVRTLHNGKMHIREAGLSEVLLPLLKNGRISVTTSHEAIQAAQTVIITVGTPLGRGVRPDLSALQQVATDLVPHVRPGQLFIVKSTVPPGTTRNFIGPILEQSGRKAGADFHLAYCPERLSEGNALNEVPRLPVVVSGIDEASIRAAEKFWRSAGLETVRAGSLEAGELVKLADNVWIDLTVALTNELALVCERLGVDAMEVIRAANSLKKGSGYVSFLHPGIGVGGSCLTKDPWFFADFAASLQTEVSLPQAGRRVNENVPARVAHVISEELKRRKAKYPAKVAVLGYAFKGSTGDTRNTPVRSIVAELRDAGCTVGLYDPWVPPDTIQQESGLPPEPTLMDCLKGASCVLLATNHPEFAGMTPARLRGVARDYFVYDGWHIWDSGAFARAGVDYFSPGKNVRSLRQ